MKCAVRSMHRIRLLHAGIGTILREMRDWHQND
jgi:hypothetical protein